MKKNTIYSRKTPIRLKDIPPLDPSSIPNNTSMSNYQKPRTRLVPVYVVKRRPEDESADKRERNQRNMLMVEEEDEEAIGGSSLSTKHIDPNSTKISNTRKEKHHEPEPEPEKIPVCHNKSRVQAKVCSDDPKRVSSAKSKLHELCVAKHWKSPAYECCNDEGPCHMRLFTYKVVIEMVESSNRTILECFGVPQSKKKIAAESAAEGALWYLKQFGHSR